MNFHASPSLLKEVQLAFTGAYPFLKIEFAGTGTPVSNYQKVVSRGLPTGEDLSATAKELLENEIHLSDRMKVGELQDRLRGFFGLRVQVLRKSGNVWLETSRTSDWTLRQQNDHGVALSSI
ncbi:MAG: hypothetical protein P4L51_26570 [Puia sp.]|nr:hypothetical protein [Puia sp.]